VRLLDLVSVFVYVIVVEMWYKTVQHWKTQTCA